MGVTEIMMCYKPIVCKDLVLAFKRNTKRTLPSERGRVLFKCLIGYNCFTGETSYEGNTTNLTEGDTTQFTDVETSCITEGDTTGLTEGNTSCLTGNSC